MVKENQINGNNVQSEAKKKTSGPEGGKRQNSNQRNFHVIRGSALCLEFM